MNTQTVGTGGWQPPVAVAHQAELRLTRLAREVAMDLHEIPTILRRYEISEEEWQRLCNMPRFQQILSAEAAAWESALNTHERVRLKSAGIMEEWLAEAYARMNDRNEALPAKVEVAKLVARLAGMGLERTQGPVESGQKFSLVINIGDQKERRISGDFIEGSELKVVG